MRASVLYMTLLLMINSSCSSGQVKSPIFEKTLKVLISNTIDVVTVQELQQGLNTEEWVVLDAREKREFEVSHLQGATWVGYDNFDINRVQVVDKNAKVVVYCSVGYRSEKIGEQLKEAGFTNVVNLYGGIFEWVNEGSSVYDGKGKTSNVHGYNSKWATFLDQGDIVLD